MSENRPVPPTDSLGAIADFWDTHSLADYWDQAEPAEFELDPNARRHYFIAVDPELLARIRKIAQRRGLRTESLINLWLAERAQDAS